MYQSPDFVKVNMNVEDVYSEYPTQPNCETNYYSGYMFKKDECVEGDKQFYNAFEFSDEGQRTKYSLGNCWVSPTA